MAFVINLEGIDRAGKGTQTALLEKKLKQSGYRVKTMHFPAYGTELGKKITDYLFGRVFFPPRVIQMLYSANRYEVEEELSRLMEECDVVVLDRYCPSGWAYGMALGLEESWLKNMDAGLPRADLVIFLDIRTGESRDRQSSEADKYEKDFSFLEKVRLAYQGLADSGGWFVVDAGGTVSQVHEEIIKVVENFLKLQKS